MLLDAYPDLFAVHTYLVDLNGPVTPLEVDVRRYAYLAKDIVAGRPNALFARGTD